MYSYYAPLLGRSRAGGGGLGHLENWMKEVVGAFCLERGNFRKEEGTSRNGGRGGCMPFSGSHSF